MGEMKPWQWVLAVVAVVVLGVSVWMTFFAGESIRNPNELILADIETGEMFVVSTSGRRLAILPAKHPESGRRTLYPVAKDDEGRWVVTPLMSESLAEYQGQAAALQDLESRIVVVVNESPRRLKQ